MGGRANPLAYPSSVTIGALAVCLAWAPFADPDQLSALAVVALAIVGYTGIRMATALGFLPDGLTRTPRTLAGRRVRQDHRLVSRSWLELADTEPAESGTAAAPVDSPGPGRLTWLPVYFDPALLSLTDTAVELNANSIRAGYRRMYPSGRARTTEPPGRLVDNPSRPDPDTAPLAARSTVPRRILLDTQSAVAAPLFGLLWIDVIGGGLGAFLGATCVAAATAAWLAAIRGSDPS